jgi:hypothetical protein
MPADLALYDYDRVFGSLGGTVMLARSRLAVIFLLSLDASSCDNPDRGRLHASAEAERSEAIAQGHESHLRAAAEELSHAADECLYDVRDRRATYETSKQCKVLSVLAKRYIDAGGMRDEPSDIALIFERARVSAWMARATSAAGGGTVRIW